MRKLFFGAAALAVTGTFALTCTMLHVAIRRKPAALPAQMDENDPVDLWFHQHAVQVVHRNRENMRLCAWFVPHAKSHKYAIVCHGYTSAGRDMRGQGKHFFDMGFNVLMPDARAHGESDGKQIGMGWPERQDIVEWIFDILKRDMQAQILLYGVSMGAATVMMTSGEVLPEQVKLVIEDCGYTSAWDQFKDTMKRQYHIHSFPVLYLASGISQHWARYNFHAASALKQVKKCRIPILFIHGEKDDFVPYEMVFKLYEAASCEKQLLTVPDAGHAQSEHTHPTLYWNTIETFIGKYLK